MKNNPKDWLQLHMCDINYDMEKCKHDPRHKDYRNKNHTVCVLDGYAKTKDAGE